MFKVVNENTLISSEQIRNPSKETETIKKRNNKELNGNPKTKNPNICKEVGKKWICCTLLWRCRIHEVENSSDLVHVQRVPVVRIQEKGPLKPVIQFCVMKQNGKDVLTKREKKYKKQWPLITLSFLPWILLSCENMMMLGAKQSFCNFWRGVVGSGTQAKPEPWAHKSVEHTMEQPVSGFPVMWDDNCS